MSSLIDYTLNEHDVNIINRKKTESGFKGNSVSDGDIYPGLIVKVFSPGTANIRVFIDGDYIYWGTSKPEGEGPGTWKRV